MLTSKEKKHMVFNEQEQQIWDAGFLASLENDSQESNPYKEGTSNYHIWDDGFECCEMRMKGK
jgi:hypothetical protein